MKRIMTAVIIFVLFFAILPPHAVKAAESSNPKIMLSHYSLDENITSDGETIVHLEFTNLSKTYSFSEILITFTSPNNTVTPVLGDTNQIYIENLEPEETITVDVPVILYETGAQYVRMDFSFLYTYAESENGTNYSYIAFTKQGDGNLVITNANIARTTNVGAQTIASVSYTNNSTSTVYNAKIHFSGDIDEEKVVNLGTVGAGETGYSENYFVFDDIGTKNLNVFLSYENEAGTETSVPGSLYSIQVNEAEVGESSTVNQGEEVTQENVQTSSTVFMVLGLITVLVVLLLIIAFFGRKKR